MAISVAVGATIGNSGTATAIDDDAAQIAAKVIAILVALRRVWPISLEERRPEG